MLRRHSGSPPALDEIEDPFQDALSPEEGDGPRSPSPAKNLRVEIANEPDNYDRRKGNPESTPRARISGSFKRSPTVPSPTEKKSDGAITIDRELAMDSMLDSRGLRRSRPRSPWACSPSTLTTTALALFLLLSIIHSFVSRQLDPQGCIMSTMTPTYIKLIGFDTEHTRFATKYGLYLYREEGVDEYSQENIGLKGAPVLFIPGNAGSYKQVRSLSSEASRYWQTVVRHDQEAVRAGARSLDFFTIDLNEDLAAFHGQTLVDQADYVNEAVAYILSLYHDPRRSRRDPGLPDPSSVILIGHSMGGIVARTVLTVPNYQPNSVNTIITMSAPHARPPLAFDSDIVHTYKQINDYWRNAYSQKWANDNPLWHVTLISIAGGGLDSIVPSDYASLSSLVPESHGFTVFTSTIQDVWTGMDHLSITWCDQFRKVIIKSLFEIVDVTRPAQTKKRLERMRVFKKWYLTGMETIAEKSLAHQQHSTLLTLEDNSNSVVTQGERLILREFGSSRKQRAHLLPIPPSGVSGKKFTLLSDQSLDASGGSGKLELLFCSVFPLQSGQSSNLFAMKMDLSGNSSGSNRLACKNAVRDGTHLPASTRQSKYAFDQVSPFTYLQYDLDDLSDHQFVAVVDKADEPTEGWVVAEFSDNSESVIQTDVGLGRLLTTGLRLKLPANRPMMAEVKVPALHSSLLAYQLRLSSRGCGEERELFTPLLRQYVSSPYESKYFVNVKEVNINLHGIAPFMPPPLRGQSAIDGVSLQLWSDPSCGTAIDLSLQVDVPGSMGKLVMRYRTVFVAFPLIIVALVLRKQFQMYDATGVFMTFAECMDLCLRSSFPVLILAMSFLAVSLANSGSRPSAQGSGGLFHWRSNGTESAIDFTKNDLLLGSQDSFFWFLVPLAGLISIGACVVVNYVALILIHFLCVIYGFMTAKSGYIKNDDKRGPTSNYTSSTPRRRLINTAILLLLVSTFIPYQFAYMVACIVQLATCTRALRFARDTKTAAHQNFYNYVHSILILMLWVLPINMPVLIVWVHNLAVHWLTPFSSHHNVLSIMPFILLVETLSSGSMVPRVTTRLRFITNILLFCIAAYAAVYGVTYAYVLHHLVNIVAAWLVAIHFSTGGITLQRLSRLIEGEDLEDSEIKKRP